MNHYTTTFAWGLDFWRTFLEKPKWRRWVCRKFMGRYAWNELVGLKRAIERTDGKSMFDPCMGGDLKSMDYREELDKYKDW